MTIALLSLGTELTRGELTNENAAWLAERLTELGHEVTEIVTTDDCDERIATSLGRLAAAHDALVCTGGLGPTTDDRTSAVVAKLLGVPLLLNEPALANLRERERKYLQALPGQGVTQALSPSNGKQALLPAGATVLANSCGTAPGFSVRIGSCITSFLPGVPREMRAMFEASVLPLLPTPEAPAAVRRVRTFGMPESQLNDRLAGLEELYGVTVGYRATLGEVELKVLAYGRAGEAEADRSLRAERALHELETRLGSVVFTRGRLHLHEHVGELLRERLLSFALAESCTGGLVSQQMTAGAGASEYYRGGVVAYSNSAKASLLGVSTETLETEGAVSKATAVEMAIGARRVFSADVSLALTGIAGPSGGTEAKPAGLVHWAVASDAGVTSHQAIFSGPRGIVQQRAALAGLWSVRTHLRG